MYKQNVLISLRLNDSVKYRRGYYFRAWVLYFSFGNARMLILSICGILACNNAIYIYLWSRLGELVRCILSFNSCSSDTHIHKI